MNQEEIAALERQLEEAFGDLPVPAEDELVYDNSGDHFECNQISARFRGRHWRDLTIEDVTEEPDALAFLTTEAFRFFLPAFIRVSLLEPERADRIPTHVLSSLARPADREWWAERKQSLLETARARRIPEQVILELAPTDEPELDAVCRARVEALTKNQKRVVRSFVTFLRKRRGEEFTFGELDKVEAALDPEEALTS